VRTRSLAEVRDTNDSRWFDPALGRLNALPRAGHGDLQSFFSPDAPLFLGRAPGRLDVMGGIADYSGSLVLELPLACATFATVQRQPAPQCDIASRRDDGVWHTFSVAIEPLMSGRLREASALAEWFAARPDDHWAAYVAGIVQLFLRRTSPDARGTVTGFRILIDSSVPEGRGVSSSAALEVATAAALAAAQGSTISWPEIAAACQWVENHVVGAPCGIMDQMTSACGRRNQLLRLRCQPGTIEGHLDIPAGYRLYGIDSGVRHSVAGADYGTVRTAAFMGYRIIAEAAGMSAVYSDGALRVQDPQWHGYLANLTSNEFSARFEQLLPERLSGAAFLQRYSASTDAATTVRPEQWYPVRAATAHPVHEQRRVERFANLMDDLRHDVKAATEMGRLMYASHASYGACGLGSAGTDRLVGLVAAAGAECGLFGAKITGGGSGGTVAVLGTPGADALVQEIVERYRAETGRRVNIFAESGPGAAEAGVLALEPGEFTLKVAD
jgi:galactokinase